MTSTFLRQVPNPNDYDPISNLKKQYEPRASTFPLLFHFVSIIESYCYELFLTRDPFLSLI